MNDTPETDAARHDLTEYGPPVPCSYGDWVAADFALKLERERDEARDLLGSYKESVAIAAREINNLKSENAKLRDIAERAIWRAVNGVCLPDASAVRAIKEEGLRLRAELDQLKEGAKCPVCSPEQKCWECADDVSQEGVE
jgi:hypothetical protein